MANLPGLSLGCRCPGALSPLVVSCLKRMPERTSLPHLLAAPICRPLPPRRTLPPRPCGCFLAAGVASAWCWPRMNNSLTALFAALAYFLSVRPLQESTDSGVLLHSDDLTMPAIEVVDPANRTGKVCMAVVPPPAANRGLRHVACAVGWGREGWWWMGPRAAPCTRTPP